MIDGLAITECLLQHFLQEEVPEVHSSFEEARRAAPGAMVLGRNVTAGLSAMTRGH